MKNNTFTLGGKKFSSRFILGSGKYSMELSRMPLKTPGTDYFFRRQQMGVSLGIPQL